MENKLVLFGNPTLSDIDFIMETPNPSLLQLIPLVLRLCRTRKVLHLTWTSYLIKYVMNTTGVCMKPGRYYPRNGPCLTLFGQCLVMKLFSTAF